MDEINNDNTYDNIELPLGIALGDGTCARVVALRRATAVEGESIAVGEGQVLTEAEYQLDASEIGRTTSGLTVRLALAPSGDIAAQIVEAIG